MLKAFRQQIINKLWEAHRSRSEQVQIIAATLEKKGIVHLPLDHFAVIDLPGPQTGINKLAKIFTTLGYTKRGADYLADKQNDFLWLAESDCMTVEADKALPQVVVADFRLDEMPANIRAIILKYSTQAQPLSDLELEHLSEQIQLGNQRAEEQLTKLILNYFLGRDWPLPTVDEFNQVQAFNELLAWVLIFGRCPNHFTLSIHLLKHFSDLNAFNEFIIQETSLMLNNEGDSIIKGGKNVGIEQSSTQGSLQCVSLADGKIEIPIGFVEFVWRYPLVSAQTPILWKDYFSHFIGQHANHVIESLYVSNN